MAIDPARASKDADSSEIEKINTSDVGNVPKHTDEELTVEEKKLLKRATSVLLLLFE